MIDAWQPPGIESVDAWEVRRLARLPVPGLAGDLHHDMGRGALSVRLIGSLSSDEEKVEIAKRYIVPRQLQQAGLTAEQLVFTDATLKQIISRYTREAGVRLLEKSIGRVTRKVAVRFADGSKEAVTATSVLRFVGTRLCGHVR